MKIRRFFGQPWLWQRCLDSMFTLPAGNIDPSTDFPQTVEEKFAEKFVIPEKFRFFYK